MTIRNIVAIRTFAIHPSKTRLIDKYEKGDVFVYLGSIKWYEGYEEIDKIKEFFDEHEEDDDNIRFVRIGEDLDDKEVMGYYQEDTIYIPSPGIHF